MKRPLWHQLTPTGQAAVTIVAFLVIGLASYWVNS